MFARVTTFQFEASRLQEIKEAVEGMRHRISAIPGLENATSVWHTDGHGIVTAVYDSEESVASAAEQIMRIWDDLADLLSETPHTETFDHLIVVKTNHWNKI